MASINRTTYYSVTMLRRVAYDEVGKMRVSTVFIGVDLRFEGSGPPLVFETTVFGGEHDGYQERYATWGEATAGHARAVALVQEELTKEVHNG